MSVFIIGDLHGHFNDYRRLLRDAALIDDDDHWIGGEHQLWQIGDFFDRGIYGIDCVALTMKLQREARQVGGEVNAILGNHEMMILCAHKFGAEFTSGGMPIIEQWRLWGGVDADLQRMEEHHAAWLEALPVMVKLDDTLLIHADAMFYVEHGRTVEAVNASFRSLLASTDLQRWENTLRAFAEHGAFSALGITGQQRAEQLLKFYGARRLVHGHTPIPIAKREHAHRVTEAWTYAGGRCINVDGGIYLGSPGFVYELAA